MADASGIGAIPMSVSQPPAYDRDTLLSILFRETDRVQRMKTPLCIIAFDIDQCQSWNPELCAVSNDEVAIQVIRRTSRLLRSYDLLGKQKTGEFLLALPGCDTFNATMLAERLRLDVFATPFQIEGRHHQLSASFGIASSDGRSPIVVLLEAEKALQAAKKDGPGSTSCFGECFQTPSDPVGFLTSPTDASLLGIR